MRMLLDVCGTALGSIRAHGFRSLLTILGIVIGVAAVIAVVAVMSGLSQSITQRFSGLGGEDRGRRMPAITGGDQHRVDVLAIQ